MLLESYFGGEDRIISAPKGQLIIYLFIKKSTILQEDSH